MYYSPSPTLTRQIFLGNNVEPYVTHIYLEYMFV